MITLKSTSDYWRIFFYYYLLEACGLPIQLVNARDVKNVPGRPKWDTHDCVRLAKRLDARTLSRGFRSAQLRGWQSHWPDRAGLRNHPAAGQVVARRSCWIFETISARTAS